MTLDKLSAFLLTMLLVLSMAVSPVFADHNVYLADSNGSQWLDVAGSENYVNRSWFDSQPIYWWADSTWNTVATNAVNAWSSAVPSRSWSKVTSSLSADLKVIVAPQTCTRACWSIKSVYQDSNRQANYTRGAEVQLTTSIPADQQLNAALHELGHHLGLDERYHHTQPYCNDSELTVMDAGGCENLQAPSSLDISRVQAMYLLTNSPGTDRSANELKSINASVSGSTMTATWLDGAWGDNYHRIAWYRWDNPSASWVQVWTENVIWNIGMRDGWDTRNFSNTYDRVLSGTPAAYYEMCGWAANVNGDHGPTACTPSLWIP